MLPPKRSGASRLLPCLHYVIMQLQTVGNSRGQRMVDPIIMYQNYGTPTKTRVVNLEDKQIVFPEDDDSDIIIVNEDYNKNTIEEGRVEHLREAMNEIVESTTETSENKLIAADAKDYIWMTTEWSPCSAPCGQIGHQIRGAACQHKKDNMTTTVEADECLSRGVTPPLVLRECPQDSCAMWRTSPWSPARCLSSGAAISRRKVECVSNNGSVLPESSCAFSIHPEKSKREEPCKPIWSVGPWSKCIGPCGTQGRQHRILRCVWRPIRVGKRLRRERTSAACEGMKRPNVTRMCDVSPCMMKDGVCRDTSRYCENVRSMNMCALRRYKEQCCKTCDD